LLAGMAIIIGVKVLLQEWDLHVEDR